MIVGVALEVVVPVPAVIRLLVNVIVLASVTTGAALAQFVPSEVKTLPDVPGTAWVYVEATQLVPSDLITFPLVAEALGNVGVERI